MRKLLALTAVAATAATAAVPALAATKTVKVGDDYFVRSGSRPTVTVHRNDTVKWVWRGKVVHNVFVTKGPQKFHSRTQVSGSFRHKMTRKGTYLIVCTIHSGMEMNLKVR
jgi:plastocyanin